MCQTIRLKNTSRLLSGDGMAQVSERSVSQRNFFNWRQHFVACCCDESEIDAHLFYVIKSTRDEKRPPPSRPISVQVFDYFQRHNRCLQQSTTIPLGGHRTYIEDLWKRDNKPIAPIQNKSTGPIRTFQFIPFQVAMPVVGRGQSSSPLTASYPQLSACIRHLGVMWWYTGR